MSSQTRWPFQGNTNELVAIMLSWDFAGAADLVRTPMLVDGVNQSAGIQGSAVTGIIRAAAGRYNILLKEPWPWLLGDDLKVATPFADVAAPYTVKVATDTYYQDPATPFIAIQVFDAAGVLADPAVGHTLRGTLTFRNRRVGSLCLCS